ncbi:uncharacterized protein LOC142976880 [Anticarsia gemmatalis]|uniref:uncharacterized protein LOC142976880 n=1 Tax=Anticarsia gemmatalis TaxID=129554 RepID=UPI003F771A55
METPRDEGTEMGEGEDNIPSDFFDDFTKDEFMEGLSVIDECWEDVIGPSSHQREARSRINAEALDSVNDLRELIGEDNGEDKPKPKPKPKAKKRRPFVIADSKYRWKKPDTPEKSELDNFIKPGSRRDPSKTNKAIKKDKEVKVQQFLAKSLESSDDLRPPGTELDDYYDEEKKKDVKMEPTPAEEDMLEQESSKSMTEQYSPSSQQRHRSRSHHSPRHRRSPRPVRHSPRPRRSPNGSPRRNFRHQSPSFNRNRFVARRYSPFKNVRRNFSPQRRSPVRRSPRRYSPGRRSPRQQRRSRSPRRRYGSRRSHSRSPRRNDTFLYPKDSNASSSYIQGNVPYQPELVQQYGPPPMHPEFPGAMPGYSYPQVPAYGSGFPDPYNYGVPQAQPGNMPMPVLGPNPVPAPPSMVPAPKSSAADAPTPYDALAQLVAEGKISQEDYLKLTPNKGATATQMDTKTRVMVLTRCNQAISKLDQLLLPNRLVLNKMNMEKDDKYLAPKYCSPLKRQAVTEFSFTKGSVSSAQQTKQLVESIISTLGLDKVVSKYKKKQPKDMKDAVVQTTKPQCDVCEIREATKYHDASTSTEPEYFTSSIHTQVVEQDLVNSKSIFNPSGSIGDGAPISISHLTPAQLVSQLAARAKTLQQPGQENQQNQFTRRPNYDYDGRGGQQYHHSYNSYNRY